MPCKEKRKAVLVLFNGNSNGSATVFSYVHDDDVLQKLEYFLLMEGKQEFKDFKVANEQGSK